MRYIRLTVLLAFLCTVICSFPSQNAKVIQDEMNSALEEFQEITIAETDEGHIKQGSSLDVLNSFVQMFEDKLKSEFRFIPVYQASSRMLTASMFPINKDKNRYSDVQCIESTRVKLKLDYGGGAGVNDYIHANYIKFPETEGTPYIATQAPKPETIDDFFEMVFEQKSDTVVTLANPIENGKVKGTAYWNPDAIASFKLGRFKSIEVVLLSTTDYIATRRFRLVKQTGKSHEFIQLHFLDWPEHASPAAFLGFIRLWEAVQRTHTPGTPLIVHCSAGIGRTGTFIAIHHLVRVIPSLKSFNPVIVRDTVNAMRKQRFGMVQTFDQYKFVYKVVGSLLRETYNQMKSYQSFLQSSTQKP